MRSSRPGRGSAGTVLPAKRGGGWMRASLPVAALFVMGLLQCDRSTHERSTNPPECAERLDLNGNWVGFIVGPPEFPRDTPLELHFDGGDSALTAVLTIDGARLGSFPCSWTDSLRLSLPDALGGSYEFVGGQDGCVVRGKWTHLEDLGSETRGSWHVTRR